MPRVHDPMNRNCARNNTTCLVYHSDGVCPDAGKIGTCTCPPTIQHEEENKECHCNAYEGHPQCSFCTCSRQDEALIPEQVKMLEGEDRYTIELQRNYGKSMFTSPTGEKQDWEARAFILASNCWDMDWMPDKSARKLFIDFIRKEKELSKEEGRMEERHKIYGDIDPLESRKIENQIVIDKARLEVIVETEDKMLREIVPSKYEHLPEHARAGAVLQDCLAIVRSLKTNSK